ncbi:NAD-dependent epimerase/dehydratase family protein [Embleya scabrispora]|uniref:NAD-dependent epimerase/dehydratase family protein n=1 Tax=Embleya scabrispora TaxID=159449 RepID=UPI000372E03A|nr:NAD(P)-dependent oxidoreductase [Embleya scabrispora]MYS84913.1 NAD-dependent epimerase/dehydratase family protein [Streptomyces sp. SID5474]
MSARRKRVVVTGGSGRLGRYVLAEFAGAHDVLNADLGPRAGGPDVAYRRTDILEPDALAAAFEGADAVVHLAGIDYDWADDATTCVRVNTMGCWNVLQVAREQGVARVVVCSSVAATGLHELRAGWTPIRLPIDDTHPSRPVDPYGISKALVEVIARGFADASGPDVVCLRPCAVVFPENLHTFLHPAAGGPRTLYDYVTAEDVARAFRAAVETPTPTFGPYLLAAADSAHPEPTLDWYARDVGELPADTDLDRFARDPHAGAVRADAAREALGWEPRGRFADLIARHDYTVTLDQRRKS